MLVAAGALLIALAGCTSSDGIAGGGEGGYISGDGSIVIIAPSDRQPAIPFAGETETGATVSSENFDGVVVLNFWYATCPPCREEADDLEELSQRYAGRVPFIGVNTRDGAATALAFMDRFGVSYSSILDVVTRDVVSAFAGDVPPSAVPTTLILDAKGRVAVRISGLLPGVTTVADLIDDVLAESD